MENWLRKVDYDTLIMSDHLDQILNDLEDPDWVLDEAELAAELEVQSYLRNRYDIPAIFMDIPDWEDNKLYLTDNVVWYEDRVYTYIADSNIGVTPDQDVTAILKDPRNQRLKQCVVDITLYHIHSRISPRNIPQLRLTRYDQCIYWLGEISKGNLDVDLPVVDKPNFKPRIMSVYTRNNWYWTKQYYNINTEEDNG